MSMERFGGTRPEQSNKMESREAFGARALEAAQELYEDEEQKLAKNVSRFSNLTAAGIAVGFPGGLYAVIKFFNPDLNIDIENLTGLHLSAFTERLLDVSKGIGGSSLSLQFLFGGRLREKLRALRERFGVLDESEE